jgi:hypothetical protein
MHVAWIFVPELRTLSWPAWVPLAVPPRHPLPATPAAYARALSR